MNNRLFIITLSTCLIAGFAMAEVLSPNQRFEIKVRNEYKGSYQPKDLNLFLRGLPWSLEDRERAVNVLGGDAIRMAALFGDYSGLLDLKDEDLKQTGPQMIRLLGNDFQGFWNSLQPQTKDILFSNPMFIRRILHILDDINKSPDSATYKALLTDNPDYLVFIYRLPSLLNVEQDRLPILLHFLQNVDFGEPNREALQNLNDFLTDWYYYLIPLYVANSEYGPVPAFVMWSNLEFFHNKSAEAQIDVDWNQQVWAVLLGQMGFIRERQSQALVWSNEVTALSALINRSPSSGLTKSDWADFLKRTGPANGSALRFLWDLRHETEKLAQIDTFLASLKNQNIPFSVMLNLLRFAKSGEDLLFLINIAQDPLYELTPAEKSMYQKGCLPLPIVLMSELATDDNFMPMLRRHRHQLITYLKDPQKGRSVQSRYNLAIQTDLKDVTYDQSAMRQICRYVPGGNLANVLVKSYKGYPVTKMEVALASVDIARAGLALATLGGSEAAAQAGTQAATTGGDVVAQKTAEKAAEATAAAAAAAGQTVAEESFWQSVQAMIAKYGDEVLQYTIEQILAANPLIESYSQDKSQAEIAVMERNILESAEPDNKPGLAWEDLIHQRLNDLPIRELTARQRLFFDIQGEEIYILLPQTNHEWFQTLDGKEPVNSILLVTLGDLP